MKNAAPFHAGKSGDPRDGRQFIHHHRVGNANADFAFARQRACEDCTQVRRVLAKRTAAQIRQHAVIDGIHAARQWTQQTAARHDDVEIFQRDAVPGQFRTNQLFAKRTLLYDAAEAFQILRIVREVAFKNALFFNENGNLGACGTGIDHQDQGLGRRFHFAAPRPISSTVSAMDCNLEALLSARDGTTTGVRLPTTTEAKTTLDQHCSAL